MNLEGWVIYVQLVSIVVGFVAAGAWLKAANVEVKKGDPRSKGSVFMNGIDVNSTHREQTRWNSYAAIFTAIAISCQAGVLLIDKISN